MTPEEFVQYYLPYAKQTEAKSGINHIFILAQGALESGWGKSAIGNNLFGITKGSRWTGKTQLVITREVFKTKTVKFTPPEEVLSITPRKDGKYNYSVKRYFRDYDSPAECFEDHLRILMQPHFAHALIYKNDPYKYVEAIQSGKMKYATSLTYVQTMWKMIDSVKKNYPK